MATSGIMLYVCNNDNVLNCTQQTVAGQWSVQLVIAIASECVAGRGTHSLVDILENLHDGGGERTPN